VLGSPKPSSPKDARVSPGAGGSLTSPSHAASGEDPTDTSSRLKLPEFPRASPPSPQSYGLGVAGGYQHGEGSFVPQYEERQRQHPWITESLWDNPEFIQAGFHLGWFVTVAVDTEADRENVKVLYSSLKTTSAQIDVSA
jgi:hypothetical protein